VKCSPIKQVDWVKLGLGQNGSIQMDLFSSYPKDYSVKYKPVKWMGWAGLGLTENGKTHIDQFNPFWRYTILAI